jgi:hypothetical protein
VHKRTEHCAAAPQPQLTGQQDRDFCRVLQLCEQLFSGVVPDHQCDSACGHELVACYIRPHKTLQNMDTVRLLETPPNMPLQTQSLAHRPCTWINYTQPSCAQPLTPMQGLPAMQLAKLIQLCQPCTQIHEVHLQVNIWTNIQLHSWSWRSPPMTIPLHSYSSPDESTSSLSRRRRSHVWLCAGPSGLSHSLRTPALSTSMGQPRATCTKNCFLPALHASINAAHAVPHAPRGPCKRHKDTGSAGSYMQWCTSPRHVQEQYYHGRAFITDLMTA